MRTLIIGALAVTMAGCSNRMPPRENLVSDAERVSCSQTAGVQPAEAEPAARKNRSAIVKAHAATAAKRKKPSPARHPHRPVHRRDLRRPHIPPPPSPVRRTRQSRIHIPEAAPSRAPRPSQSNNSSRPRRQSPNESRHPASQRARRT